MTQTIDALASGLTVFAISDTEWKISDATRPECDGFALLAFVERVGSRYEVTELAKPWRRTYSSSLSAAIDTLARVRETRRTHGELKLRPSSE
jgi:hypothetical protein